MAEYYAVLSKAVAGLTESADARRKVYDKARNALIGQLKAIDPPLAAQEISRQRLELEEAIRRVERESAAAAMTAAPRAPRHEPLAAQAGAGPSPEEVFRQAVEEAGASERAATDARRPSSDWAGVRQAEPARAEPIEPERQRLRTESHPAPHEPEPVPEPNPTPPPRDVSSDWPVEPRQDQRRAYRQPDPRPGEQSDDYWDNPAEGDDRGDPRWAGDGGRPVAPAAVIPDPFDEDEHERPRRKRRGRRAERDLLDAPARRSRLPAIMLSFLLIILVGGLAALAWLQRDRIEDLIAVFDAQIQQPAPQTQAATPREGGLSEPAKIADRLLSGEDPGGVRQVGSQDGPVLPAQPAEPGAVASLQDPGATLGDAPPLPTLPGSEPQAGSGAQAATLYEEPVNAAQTGEEIVAIEAQVAWRFVPANGATGDQVVADINVPARGMDIGVSIWENDDDSLPASHLVEIVVRSSNVAISQVPRLVLKGAEGGRGQPLIGASAKVADGIFWVALSSNQSDVSFNTDLLGNQGWLDIPLVYDSGQRAIITVAKGEIGQQVVSQALAAWSVN